MDSGKWDSRKWDFEPSGFLQSYHVNRRKVHVKKPTKDTQLECVSLTKSNIGILYSKESAKCCMQRHSLRVYTSTPRSPCILVGHRVGHRVDYSLHHGLGHFVSSTSSSPCVPQSTRLPDHKSRSHTSLVHTSPNHVVPVPPLVTVRRSLLIYTSTPLYIRNWQPVIWIMAPPFWMTQN